MKQVIVYAPSRLSVVVLNMNRLQMGIAGGGGIAFSPSHYAKITISIIQRSNDVIFSPNYLAVEYYLERFRQMHSLNSHYCVEVQSDLIPHSGEGSSHSIILGLLKGLLYINGIELSDADLFKSYTKDIKEEHDGYLVRGYASGTGAWSVLRGGVTLSDDSLSLVRSIPIGNCFRVLVIRPKNLKRLSYQMESSVIHDGGKQQDLIDYDQKKCLLSNVLKYDNCQSFHGQMELFHLLSEFCSIGSKIKEFNTMNTLYGGLYDYLAAIGIRNRIALHGLSSLGPTYYYVDEKERIAEMSEVIDSTTFYSYIYSFSNGIRVQDVSD